MPSNLISRTSLNDTTTTVQSRHILNLCEGLPAFDERAYSRLCLNGATKPPNFLRDNAQEITYRITSNHGDPVPTFCIGQLVISSDRKISTGNEADCPPSDHIRTMFQARMLHDGTIQLMGLAQDFESQILAALMEDASVLDACLFRHTHVLKAFIATQTPRNDGKAMSADVACRILKAHHLTIESDQVHFVNHIPRTRAGKLDSKALRTIHERPVGSLQRTETEHWSQVSSAIRVAFHTVSQAPLNQIALQTTIFRLGLDSITAIQLAKVLRETWSFVTAGDVLQNPTCAALAAFIESKDQTTQPAAEGYDFEAFENLFKGTIRTEHTGVETANLIVRPCTPMQSGILSEYVRSSGQKYCNYLSVRLDSSIKTHRARQAWVEVVQHRQLLRTGFAEVGDAQSPFAMITYESSSGLETLIQSEVKDVSVWRREAAENMFRNLQKPPWRAHVRAVQGGIVLDLHILHALYDAHSLDMMLFDFQHVLAGRKLEMETAIDPVLGEIMRKAGTEDTSAESFWKTEGELMRVARFPDLKPLQSSNGSLQSVSRKCKMSLHQIEAACQEAEVTVQAAAQAAWGRLLSAYVGEEEVTFGIVLSGRSSEEANMTCFPCITTVPFAYKESTYNRSALTRSMDFNNTIRNYQFVPLSSIQRWVGRGKEPLFDTVFAYQRTTSEQRGHSWTIMDEYAPTDVSLSLQMPSLTLT